MPQHCAEFHLLELWANKGKFDNITDAAIGALTDEAVLEKVNQDGARSGLSGMPFAVETWVGGIERDQEGKIISGKALLMLFISEKTESKDDPDEPNELTMEFEEAFIDLANDFDFGDSGLKAYPNAARSFGDIFGGAVGGDVQLFIFGYVVVIVYVVFMTGKLNSVEFRGRLSLSGILAVVMGIGACYGLCSGIGLFYTSLHTVLPFLILGIGIDDMFVIVQSFDNVVTDNKDDLVERFGQGMKKAGVAITITSLTDFLAFGISATSELPILTSFCLYAAFGVVFVFVFMATFFLGFFVYDERRVLDRRDSIISCCKRSNHWQPNKCSQVPIMSKVLEFYGKVLTFKPVKALVLVVSLALAIAG